MLIRVCSRCHFAHYRKKRICQVCGCEKFEYFDVIEQPSTKEQIIELLKQAWKRTKRVPETLVAWSHKVSADSTTRGDQVPAKTAAGGE